jgi:FAD/FMN-containing dehydrogenase
LEVAISGGRHSASGASSSEGGLVIDLSKMRKVKVDKTKNHIIAQGGCLWVDVDTAAAKYDLATGYSLKVLCNVKWEEQSIIPVSED